MTIRDAAKVAVSDPKILLVGSVQALFEGAMYIFVLQWPPSIAAAVGKAFAGGATPYGTVFSCFMVCCLLGSATFGAVAKAGVRTEVSTLGMLGFATLAMGAAAAGTGGAVVAALAPLAAAFFCFEACVGMYFPSIGTLRSRYVPDSHRSTIKVPPWQRASSAPVPPQGAPGGSGQLGTPMKRPAHWAPSHCLGCLS